MTSELMIRTNKVNLTVPYSELVVIEHRIFVKVVDGEIVKLKIVLCSS